MIMVTMKMILMMMIDYNDDCDDNEDDVNYDYGDNEDDTDDDD